MNYVLNATIQNHMICYIEETICNGCLPSILEKAIPLHCIGYSLHNHGPLSFSRLILGYKDEKFFQAKN
jgi:hypothetical protein